MSFSEEILAHTAKDGLLSVEEKFLFLPKKIDGKFYWLRKVKMLSFSVVLDVRFRKLSILLHS